MASNRNFLRRNPSQHRSGNDVVSGHPLATIGRVLENTFPETISCWRIGRRDALWVKLDFVSPQVTLAKCTATSTPARRLRWDDESKFTHNDLDVPDLTSCPKLPPLCASNGHSFFFHPLNEGVVCQLSTCARRIVLSLPPPPKQWAEAVLL